jgi:hypothetical protein
VQPVRREVLLQEVLRHPHGDAVLEVYGIERRERGGCEGTGGVVGVRPRRPRRRTNASQEERAT